MSYAISAVLSVLLHMNLSPGEWPTIRGNSERTGLVSSVLRPPFRVSWARHFAGERLGSAFEPILGAGQLYVTTHSGSLIALDAESGEPRWRFCTASSLLHSPAYDDGLVVTASADGRLYAVEIKTGKPRWEKLIDSAGISASPAILGNRILIGSRGGRFVGVQMQSGEILWARQFPAPIRQTAAISNNSVFITAEDLRVRCLDAATGEAIWTSEQLAGQTARDYHPIVVEAEGKAHVIVRTSPLRNMAQQIAQDRHLLCESAGVDDSEWQKLDAWTKDKRAVGNTKLWEQEQRGIIDYLEADRASQTMFALDATTGEELPPPPVLWVGGCQGVAVPPTLMPDGRLLVFYRSAYGNWNHGVAPLVGLGILDLERNRIEPLIHQHGMQPPWNTFWGTADEAQNFVSLLNALLMVHQGTLSAYLPESHRLSLIAGNRDSWGGYRNPPWARNEWHGPARGGVAVTDRHIYWATGSRVLCIAMGEEGPAAEGPAAEDVQIDVESIPTRQASVAVTHGADSLAEQLLSDVEEWLSTDWAPLMVEPGLARRQFFFAQSGEVFESLSWAFPHLPLQTQIRVRRALETLWSEHPPLTLDGWFDVTQGTRRESFWVPDELLVKVKGTPEPHPFGSLYSVWLYAERCDAWDWLSPRWPELHRAFTSFQESGWHLDVEEGDLFVNRYLASLVAFSEIAKRMGEADLARQAGLRTRQTAEALIARWHRVSSAVELPVFQNISEWDAFLGSGDALLQRVSTHNAKLALFHDLTPQVATHLREHAPNAVTEIWRAFEMLCPTWYLMGEERQVHTGENYVDPPDFALAAFRAASWLAEEPSDRLATYVDIPFGHADLYHLMKLGIRLDQLRRPPK